MRRRERYSMQITCPRCGKTGRVVWAESRMLSYGSGVDCAPKLVSSGFRTGPGAVRAGTPPVYCEACDTPVSL